MTAQAVPLVRHEQFKTADPERAHGFLRQAYADHDVRFSGSREGFTFVHTMTSAPGFSIRRVRHSMATVTDADSLGGMLIVQQVIGGRLEVNDGQDTVRASRSRPLLLPPLRSVHLEWDDLDLGVITIDPAVVADHTVVRHVARNVRPNAQAVASPAGTVEPTALHRAVAFIDAHADEDIGIAEIADYAMFVDDPAVISGQRVSRPGTRGRFPADSPA